MKEYTLSDANLIIQSLKAVTRKLQNDKDGTGLISEIRNVTKIFEYTTPRLSSSITELDNSLQNLISINDIFQSNIQNSSTIFEDIFKKNIKKVIENIDISDIKKHLDIRIDTLSKDLDARIDKIDTERASIVNLMCDDLEDMVQREKRYIDDVQKNSEYIQKKQNETLDILKNSIDEKLKNIGETSKTLNNQVANLNIKMIVGVGTGMLLLGLSLGFAIGFYFNIAKLF